MEVSFTVDWIAATGDEKMVKQFVALMERAGKHSSTPCAGAKGYNRGLMYNTGMRVSWHDKREEQGVHVVLGGAALRWYDAAGVDWYDILSAMKRHGMRTSRVDLAIDVRDSGIKHVDLCEQSLKPYKGRGRTPRISRVLGADDSWTVYVGSRQSEKMLRVYDKGKELGEKDIDYIRIELECKGEIAHAIGWEFPNMVRLGCVGMAQTLIRGQADFGLENWEATFQSERVELTIARGRERDTMTWLVKQCAPALAKQIVLYPDEDVLDTFWEALRRELQGRGMEV